jgi:hypothetical protein
VALRGEDPASYYGRTFDADWAAAARGGGGATVANWRVNATLAAGGLAAIVLAGFVLRRTVEFE